VAQVRWASLRRTRPISAWGYDRGTPVDRWYVERFLAEHAHLVRGHVLEVKEDLYASTLGAARITVLDIDAANPRATLIGDLVDPSTLPAGAYDTAVITQTLQYVSDPAAAVANLITSLAPGGHLLLTTPLVSRLSGPQDRWRWTALGMRTLLADHPGAQVAAHGNCLAARAFLAGLAAEDVGAARLRVQDPQYPLLVTAVVPKA
jgi:SAM-dependent methyltransferase